MDMTSEIKKHPQRGCDDGGAGTDRHQHRHPSGRRNSGRGGQDLVAKCEVPAGVQDERIQIDDELSNCRDVSCTDEHGLDVVR